jgi:uncharacterized membrane protein
MKKSKSFSLHLFLLLSLLFTASLVCIRHLVTGNFTYSFLLWNLFLAVIPFLLSERIKKSDNWPRWQRYLFFAAWLAFLPNSFYLITDLFHLRQSPTVPLYFDLVLLFSAAWNGILLGLHSLFNVESYLRRKFSPGIVMLTCLLALAACAFGIYLGRYQRLNSWEIVSNPMTVLQVIAQRVLYPFDHLRTWAITGLFTGFLSLLYFYFSRVIKSR